MTKRNFLYKLGRSQYLVWTTMHILGLDPVRERPNGGNKVVKIRLKKFGTKKRPYYRIVIQDSKKPRDGTTVEEIGQYRPIDPVETQVAFNEERAKYWLSVGAQPTPIVKKLFNTKGLTVTGKTLTK